MRCGVRIASSQVLGRQRMYWVGDIRSDLLGMLDVLGMMY